MKGATLLRFFCVSSRRLVQSRPKFIQNPKSTAILRHANLSLFSRFYSSESDSSTELNSAQIEKRNRSIDDVDVVSDEELKMRIERFYEGDGEAIPSIFEAILTRKLAGINDDENLMKELRQKFPTENLGDEGDFDFDEEEEEEEEIDEEN